MLRLATTDPLAQSLFTPQQLSGVRKFQRVKKGKRAGALTTVQEIELGFEARGIKGFVREYPFATSIGRRWLFDFAWLAEKVAVEFEGLNIRKVGKEFVLGGRHATITGFTEDCVKYNTAQGILGWTVLRYVASHVRDGTLYDEVQNVLALKRSRSIA
jgi:hypothetical protein